MDIDGFHIERPTDQESRCTKTIARIETAQTKAELNTIWAEIKRDDPFAIRFLERVNARARELPSA